MRIEDNFLTVFIFCSGVLKGEDNEVASTMQFKPDFETGALLTVVILPSTASDWAHFNLFSLLQAWSSGRIQHVAFSFLPQHLEA